MTTISDDFNRANGPIGSNWVTSNPSIVVSGNALYPSNSNATRHVTPLGSGRHSVTVRAYCGNVSCLGAGPAVKVDAGAGTYYYAVAAQSSNPDLFLIAKHSNSGWHTLASCPFPRGAPAWSTITLTWDSGHLTASLDGAYNLSVDDAEHAANTYVGFFSERGDSNLDDWTASSDPPLSLNVTPDPLWAGGGSQLMIATGTSIAWTVGIPGSSTITANHGTVEMQACTSATTIQFLYTPADYIGPITISESQYGLTDTINAQATVPSGYGPLGGTMLSPQVLTWLENQAAHGGYVLADNDTLTANTSGNAIKSALGEVLLGTRQAVGDANTTLSNPALLALLWRLMNGGSQPVVGPFPSPSFNTLDQGLGQIDGKIDTLVGEAGWTLAELLFSLGGNPVISTSYLSDQITALDMTGGTAIISAISTLRGSDTATVAALVSSLSSLRTADGYTLASVKGWIDSLPDAAAGPSAVAVVALLAALWLAIPTGGLSIAAEAVAVGAGPLLDIATLVEVVSVLGELAGIASSIASIRDSLSPAVSAGAPIWPGLSARTLGTSSDLGASGTITEAMDGVIVTIDHCDTDHRPAYVYDGFRSWANIGQLVFLGDDGQADERQSLNFEKQVYTPKSLARASAVKWYTGHGPVGTIRAWTVTP